MCYLNRSIQFVIDTFGMQAVEDFARPVPVTEITAAANQDFHHDSLNSGQLCPHGLAHNR